MRERLEQLDSIRGLAALAVFFNHMFLVLPAFTAAENSYWVVSLLRKTPLSLIWEGQGAVLIFFILSGFVLSLAFYGGKAVPYSGYIVKRISRLYIPYIALVAAGILLNVLFYGGHLDGASDWFNSQWASDITIKSILAHVLFVGDFQTHAFDPPIWSLVHEMRISIIFPVLMFLIVRMNWKQIIPAALVLSLVGFLGSKAIGSSNINYFITIHYAAMFVIGALLAKHRANIIGWYNKTSTAIRFGLLVIATPLLLTYPAWALPGTKILHVQLINDWAMAVGAVILIGSALASPTLIKVLKTRPLLHLGKISYSFYLTHFVVMLTFVYTMFDLIPIWAIWSLTLVVTLALATVLYYAIEVPSIVLGRRLSSRKIQKPAIVESKKARTAI